MASVELGANKLLAYFTGTKSLTVLYDNKKKHSENEDVVFSKFYFYGVPFPRWYFGLLDGLLERRNLLKSAEILLRNRDSKCRFWCCELRQPATTNTYFFTCFRRTHKVDLKNFVVRLNVVNFANPITAYFFTRSRRTPRVDLKILLSFGVLIIY